SYSYLKSTRSEVPIPKEGVGNIANSESAIQSKGKKRDASQNKPKSVDENDPKSASINAKIDKLSAILESEEKTNTGVDDDKKKKKKRKRKEVNDLRFAAEMEKLGVTSKRKQRKKDVSDLSNMPVHELLLIKLPSVFIQYRFLKNKKKKQKKGSSEQTLDLPKRDEVKFGDVVQAPPKLDVVPKAPKKPMNASQERLRLQAIQAYRDRRGNNRLGIQLPSLCASSEEQ
ncbi:hypothetical protein KSS87_006266, partial [Heliosperma pusillum]